jgi:nicotinamidase-related amidase
MLTVENTVLVIIDVQEKLAPAMHEKEKLFDNLQKLAKGVKILEIPIILTEQNPKGLGPTIPEIARLLPDILPITKMDFSCCNNKLFRQELGKLNRKQVLIAGIEMHVCVYQTAVDLLALGYEVQVVADACASRTAENKKIGLKRTISEGAKLTSTEMALFELLKVAEGTKFKKILHIVK